MELSTPATPGPAPAPVQLSELGPVFVDSDVAAAFLSGLGSGTVGERVWKWLRTPPRDTVLRAGGSLGGGAALACQLSERLGRTVTVHPEMGEVVVVAGAGKLSITPALASLPALVVDQRCGLAVLRGAAVFCPGVLAAPSSLQPGMQVSVWADLDGGCLKGAKQYSGRAVCVGAGVARMGRGSLFCPDPARGVAVTITHRLFDCPSLEPGPGYILQNLPSLLAVHALDPQPGHTVLDMCAAPGGKTSHCGQRVSPGGGVVALDRSKPKVASILQTCARLGLDNVTAFVADGRKAVAGEGVPPGEEGAPPFPPCRFDRVLVDAPCSGLGQRPQFYNKMRMKELKSFPVVQRALLASAVSLLRPGGVLVYSTCTNNREENEEVTQWASLTFPCLERVESRSFGHPDSKIDTISFYYCKFVKK